MDDLTSVYCHLADALSTFRFHYSNFVLPLHEFCLLNWINRVHSVCGISSRINAFPAYFRLILHEFRKISCICSREVPVLLFCVMLIYALQCFSEEDSNNIYGCLFIMR